MHDACRELAVAAGWRLKSLRRCRKYHTKAEMFRLYKAQILSFIISRTAGIHFAAASNLSCIDRIQRRFLSEMNVSEADALIAWNLAPLECRRHIAMLGFLYRVAWGIAPDNLCELFKWKAPAGITGYLRGLSSRHAWQFEEPINSMGSRHTDAVARSAFGARLCGTNCKWKLCRVHQSSCSKGVSSVQSSKDQKFLPSSRTSLIMPSA